MILYNTGSGVTITHIQQVTEEMDITLPKRALTYEKHSKPPSLPAPPSKPIAGFCTLP